ncbi:MAG: Ig-like domain-containing protein [Bacteroidales bacterium]|nr:Ig-like domain-containing protein [Bacteroidales bacterium]
MNRFISLFIFGLTFVLCSCGGGGGDKSNGPITPSNVTVSSITLSKTSSDLVIGSTLQLTATLSPSNATDKTITWSSSNTSIATVTPTGLVTAKAEGSTNITASAGGKNAVCKITVKKPAIAVTSIELDKTDITLDAGETSTIKATVKPDNATVKTITWTSSKPTVATVDGNGKVTGLDNGTTNITATCGDKTAICKVTVKVLVKSISLDQSSATIIKGEIPLILQLTITPENAADKTIKWSSSNINIATVKNGVVTAVNAGDAVITAEVGDKKAQCKVTVVLCRTVDLGLSVKWADRNIGANSEEEYGDYYAWGEIETKDIYTWDTYKWGTEYNLTKYLGKCTLDLSDDIANVVLGGNWRMPTERELWELISGCDWNWTTISGINGFRVVSKKNGNSIFLPAGGLRTDNIVYNNITGDYWSSSHGSWPEQGASFLQFSANMGKSITVAGTPRSHGYTIRAVTK